jgi:hypothetical protein
MAFISGFVLVVAFFFRDDTPIGGLRQEFTVWLTIVGGFTLILGVASIIRVNWSSVAQKKAGWGYKLLTLGAVFAMAIPSVLPASWATYVVDGETFSLFGHTDGSIYDWLFNYMQAPMMATMFATLAFYIASAAYRAFRARSAQASLLLVTATLIMLVRVPMGEALLEMLPGDVPGWLNTYIMSGVNMAVQRGIIIGAALGAASMALRIMLGIERTYMGNR